MPRLSTRVTVARAKQLLAAFLAVLVALGAAGALGWPDVRADASLPALRQEAHHPQATVQPLTMFGNEYTGLRKPKNPHILAYDTDWVASDLPKSAGWKNVQSTIASAVADGGWCVLAHPTFQWGDTDSQVVSKIARLNGYAGIEVFNGRSIRGGSDAEPIWDALLDLSADKHVWGYGNDDFHGPKDLGVSYNVALASERSVTSIRHALKTGNSYVVTGSRTLRIESIRVEGSRIRAETNEGTQIEFLNAKGILGTSWGKNGDYDCTGTEGYVRVRVVGATVDERAYSQPIAVAPGPTLSSPYIFERRVPCKANMHAHTTISDARIGNTPAVVSRLYAQAGYDLLAITDHDWLSKRPVTKGPTVAGRKLPFLTRE